MSYFQTQVLRIRDIDRYSRYFKNCFLVLWQSRTVLAAFAEPVLRQAFY
jgi:hypothetical protein